MMVQCTRQLVLLVWFLLVFTSAVCHCSSGSRLSTDVFKVEPKSQFKGHFLGFLPRRSPIPASGPSRKHNELGLQSWRSP
ncbi:hypothetical protein V6N12_022146 [Hibiscus sabdariffa]|uniref:Protein IDA-LIKE 2 n=1 Tax=Hibiscus sabdariffa TaxID=183260 RepID=A0ABR2FU44_9ROSI